MENRLKLILISMVFLAIGFITQNYYITGLSAGFAICTIITIVTDKKIPQIQQQKLGFNYKDGEVLKIRAVIKIDEDQLMMKNNCELESYAERVLIDKLAEEIFKTKDLVVVYNREYNEVVAQIMVIKN